MIIILLILLILFNFSSSSPLSFITTVSIFVFPSLSPSLLSFFSSTVVTFSVEVVFCPFFIIVVIVVVVVVVVVLTVFFPGISFVTIRFSSSFGTTLNLSNVESISVMSFFKGCITFFIWSTESGLIIIF